MPIKTICVILNSAAKSLSSMHRPVCYPAWFIWSIVATPLYLLVLLENVLYHVKQFHRQPPLKIHEPSQD
jgi:hypothetical protein